MITSPTRPARPTESRAPAGLRALWAEPQVPGPARVPWWDLVLSGVLVVASVVEGLARAVPWPAWHIGLAAVVALAVLGRSRRPLVSLAVGLGAQTLAGVVPALAGAPYAVLNTTSVLLLLAYSLGRWASGRGVLAGVVLLMLAHFGREPLYGSTGTQNTIGAAALLLPVAFGATVRFWLSARERTLEQVRLRERTALARELHDTVAHHVSGIVVQAQAGQAVASSDPGRAVAVLVTVEHAAGEALREMRALVGVLRDGTPAELLPGHGLDDLAALAHPGADGRGGSGPGHGPGAPRVEVDVPGDLQVPASVGQAMFRVAQEAVTNARWHAHRASLVSVRVRELGAAGSRTVVVEVADDGAPLRGSARGRGSGYGIVGMTERVEALGGTLQAGPGPEGWRVTATIPVEDR